MRVVNGKNAEKEEVKYIWVTLYDFKSRVFDVSFTKRCSFRLEMGGGAISRNGI
jgi:hypothetical protein